MEKTTRERWLKKRKSVFIAFCGISFGLGFEISLMFPSLYFYMHDVIKTKNAKLFYGIALSAYPLSGIIGAFTIAKYADRTKHTRLVILCLLSCEIVGNFLYSLGYSPWCPVFGRFIAGFGDVASMVIVAEIQRCYETDIITSKITTTVFFFSLGFILSPGTTIFFKLFDFFIGSFHLVYANLVSLFTMFIFCVLWVLTYAVVTDLSKECDLKETEVEKVVWDIKQKNDQYSKNDNTPLLAKNINDIDADYINDFNDTGLKHSSIFLNKKDFFKSIVTSFDLCLLLCFCFVCSFVLFGLDTMVPLIGSSYFGFDAKDISIIYIIDGILYGLVLAGLAKIASRYADFHIILFAVCIEILGLVSVLCIQVHHDNIYFNYVCLCVYVVAFSSAWCIEEVLTRSLFGKLVPSSCQSYAEGIRRSTSNVAFIISGVTTAGLFEYLTVTASVLIGCMVIMFGMFYQRKMTLLCPTPQFSITYERRKEEYQSMEQP